MAQSNVIRMVGAKEAPRSVRSKMDTLELTIDALDRWKKPPFQREQRMTKKVRLLVAELKESSGVIPGILTLGRMDGDTYLIDGQHRVAAFRESGLETGYADVRICEFDNMGEMGAEFVKLNSSLVRMKNEDILRGLEGVNPLLAQLRRRCPFIGYEQIRVVDPKAGIARRTLSATVALRSWYGSAVTPNAGPASTACVDLLTEESVEAMTDFYSACYEAWGGDKPNFRLWGALNVTVLAWLWRRTVLGENDRTGHGGLGPMRITRPHFIACMMSASADSQYTDWLVGRGINNDRDKSPCYRRLQGIFARRLSNDGQRHKGFPGGDWQKS